MSKVLFVSGNVGRKSTDADQEVRPGAGLRDMGVQEICHPSGQTPPQVTISKSYKGPFPNLVSVLLRGTASFKVPSAWNLEDSGVSP